jgi:hypothetical protein
MKNFIIICLFAHIKSQLAILPDQPNSDKLYKNITVHGSFESKDCDSKIEQLLIPDKSAKCFEDIFCYFKCGEKEFKGFLSRDMVKFKKNTLFFFCFEHNFNNLRKLTKWTRKLHVTMNRLFSSKITISYYKE